MLTFDASVLWIDLDGFKRFSHPQYKISPFFYGWNGDETKNCAISLQLRNRKNLALSANDSLSEKCKIGMVTNLNDKEINSKPSLIVCKY